MNVLCLNCCGIKSRLRNPEFCELINSFDIVCFVETKTDDIDVIDFPGFIFNMKNRKMFSNRRSGGIVVGYRESLKGMIHMIDTDSRYVLWFKCQGKLLNLDESVLFGAIYIPPEYTKYSSEEAFNELEREYLNLSNTTKCVCLLGDFNARTSSDDDFIIIDEEEHNDISNFVNNYTGVLNSLSLPIKRVSQDKTKNRYGNLLLNFCKGHNLFIMNGRMGNDKNVGGFTCREASVVDYFISSPDLLKYFSNFEIHEKSKLFSDVHRPIGVTVSNGMDTVEQHKKQKPPANIVYKI